MLCPVLPVAIKSFQLKLWTGKISISSIELHYREFMFITLFLILTCRRLLALGDGDWEPPLSDSFPGGFTPNRLPFQPGVQVGSESRLLEQSRSESLGANPLLWSLLQKNVHK